MHTRSLFISLSHRHSGHFTLGFKQQIHVNLPTEDTTHQRNCLHTSPGRQWSKNKSSRGLDVTKWRKKGKTTLIYTHTCSIAWAFALSSSFSRSFSALFSAVDVVLIARKSKVIHSSLYRTEGWNKEKDKCTDWEDRAKRENIWP